MNAPTHLIPKLRTSIFYNSQGKMVGADTSVVAQHIITTVVSTWMIIAIILIILPIPFNGALFVSVSIFGSLISLVLFYRWGWKNYSQAWYHVDTENQLLTVIQKVKGEWEEIEIPFEQVNKVEWSGGTNGYAIIHAAGLEIDTTRASTDRFASVTEMWPLMAKFDTYMAGWPITLECAKCNRQFGHHIGTAQCPFDEMMLNDPTTKGRIDPEELHPDDYSRV